ncbi:hypothetical protein DFA_10715 [Cavenderia fasciculata]|uniref:Ribosomal protein L27 n=1 Tax=Cavenderia fasciculata TaxID=261658 RepID=F4QB70_CACFS|nr:uncharacterized protein DFA_10715 [Cavenderia fasciculata]EGG14842.1 hypothetical protein DFA_10715 [Cavenderia fasciculata]|eukprot:XP_004351358.1 hypothetical protein DFA_10715 [Cavenderia fasciculata]
MWGASIFNNVTRLCVNTNSVIQNQVRNLYKHKSKSACKKRFMLTKTGKVKFHPRANPGTVAYVTNTAVLSTFRGTLFSQAYTKSKIDPYNKNPHITIIEVEEEEY